MWRFALMLGLVLAMQVSPAAAEPIGPYMVFFDRGQDTLTPQAEAILRSAIEDYKANGEAGQVMLSGHTDRAGDDAANVGLSQRRAARVREFMAAHGIADGVITTESFGESRLLVDTADGVAEPMNNRVEITVGPPSGW